MNDERTSYDVWGAAIALQAALAMLLGLVLIFLWGLTGAGYFWPKWVLFGLAVPLAIQLAIRLALRVDDDRHRALALHAAASGWIAAVLLAVYALAGGGTFWPLWAVATLGLALGAHAIVVVALPSLRPQERELEARVDVLTRTRAGALDVQAAELRRIERDLHDGAQARLVALSMQLGRAEERLEGQPEIAELVRRAREEAGAAIGELRDLARGIAPPVLADRGLVAAVEALGVRAQIPVTVNASILRRPLPVIETAAYFVVAEALTNAAKHARRRRGHRRAGRPRRPAGRRGARRRPGRRRRDRHRAHGPAPSRRGARRHPDGLQPRRRRDDRARGAAMRVVIVEDQALLREGIVALLREQGIDVVAQAEDGAGLLRIVAGHKPDLAIVDVRLPPSFTDEGLRAALEARVRQPGLGVLVLSQYVEPVYTAELLESGEGGIGYLLKERVGDVRGVRRRRRSAWRRGGTALDREVVAELVRSRTGQQGDGALAALTPREREVLDLMAEGRTNAAIARAMVVTSGAVEKHVSSIFGKLDLPSTDDDHRRVLAVLAYLRAA